MLDFNDDEVKDWLREILQEGIVTVKFTKKDDTERVMKCTLKQDLIPSEHQPKGSNKVKPSESIAVFDVENDGWRSFRFDSVKELGLII
jgi:hypothetical protein